ncbi:MAG TPA: hypothetical protein VN938_13895 [Xanthobacteraceae bacterium]|nr:hypothetical protein [Xanthobacteraceae bacterium]
MRGLIAFLLSVTFAAYATPSMASSKIRLAQSSTATNCMMGCNAQAASCQTACLVPSAQLSQNPNGGVTSNNANPLPNATANTICLSACTTSQLTCQTSCARLSPSQ